MKRSTIIGLTAALTDSDSREWRSIKYERKKGDNMSENNGLSRRHGRAIYSDNDQNANDETNKATRT